MAALLDALDLLRHQWLDPRLLHHGVGWLLFWLPLGGALLLAVLDVVPPRKPRPAFFVLAALLPVLLIYEALLLNASTPPPPAEDLAGALGERLDPGRSRYRSQLVEHRAETHRLAPFAALLFGLALWGILRGKPARWLRILMLLVALLASALALLLLQRKVRFDHPELPPGGEALEEALSVAS